MQPLPFFAKYDQKMNENQKKQLHDYFLLIQEYNKVMNLTGIDDYEGVYLKHFFDSLTITQDIDKLKPKTIADVGTGAGMPGIILAIYYPDIKFTLIEPLRKRIDFLQIVIANLKLDNVVLLNARAEDIDNKFDLVVSRAVSRLNILLELCMPLTNDNKYFIALKGPKAVDEIKEAKNALNVLNSKIIESNKVILPIEESIRYNIIIKRTGKIASKYPRNYSQIKSMPL